LHDQTIKLVHAVGEGLTI